MEASSHALSAHRRHVRAESGKPALETSRSMYAVEDDAGSHLPHGTENRRTCSSKGIIGDDWVDDLSVDFDLLALIGHADDSE